MLEMALLDQHRRFVESGPMELNEDQRLAYELQFIEIQLSMVGWRIRQIGVRV